MKGENYRLVGRQQRVEIMIFQAMGMLRARLQHHQVHHVDDTDTDVGHIGVQERDSSQCLERRYIARASHDHVGITGIITGPMPNARASGAVANRRIHLEPLPLRLFAGDDDVHIVKAAQTVIRDREQTIRIRRQINPHDVGFFVRDMINETGILMRKAIMVLPPCIRGEQIIE